MPVIDPKYLLDELIAARVRIAELESEKKNWLAVDHGRTPFTTTISAGTYTPAVQQVVTMERFNEVEAEARKWAQKYGVMAARVDSLRSAVKGWQTWSLHRNTLLFTRAHRQDLEDVNSQTTAILVEDSRRARDAGVPV